MHKNITCIACPRGCLLTVSGEAEDLIISGNECMKGTEYGRQEILEPLRMLTTTVRTTHPVYTRLPVRLSREVPLEQIPEFMKVINQVCVSRTCIPGDVMAVNLLESEVDLIATGELYYEKG